MIMSRSCALFDSCGIWTGKSGFVTLEHARFIENFERLLRTFGSSNASAVRAFRRCSLPQNGTVQN